MLVKVLRKGRETTTLPKRPYGIGEYGHDGVVYSGWFLPSKDELNLMYQNLKENGLGSFDDGDFWSSSEGSAFHAWTQNFHDGGQNDGTRGNECRVRPVRRF